MSKRLICSCGYELSFPTQFCLSCGKRNAFACGVYVNESFLHSIFIGEVEETIKLKRYEDSVRNTYEILADKIYERRLEEIYVSAFNEVLLDEAFSELEKSYFPFRLYRTDIFDSFEEFSRRLRLRIKVERELPKVDARAEEKIGGSHSTIIGGRDGYNLILRLAASPYVKKVVPGVIEVGSGVGGGVRMKLTRSDNKGNLRALLIDGNTVQQVHVITTARNKEEGEEILKMLSSVLKFS